MLLNDNNLQNLTLLAIEHNANERTLKEFKPITYPNGHILEQLGIRLNLRWKELIYWESHKNLHNYFLSSHHFSYQTWIYIKFFRVLFFHIIPLYCYSHILDIYHTWTEKNIWQNHTCSSYSERRCFIPSWIWWYRKLFMLWILASSLKFKHHFFLHLLQVILLYFLLSRGRTTHSKFKIIVLTLDNSTCKIEYNDDMIKILRKNKLIIWDEESMTHKYYFETLDRTLKDIMSVTSNYEYILGGRGKILLSSSFNGSS